MNPPLPGRPGGARRRTSAELDELLDGGQSGDPQLDRVLSAARGPARPHELAPLAPAVGTGVRFRVPSRAASRSRRVLTRLGAATLLTKAMTAAAGAAVVGAAAVAGATHHLPGQDEHGPRTAVAAPSTTSVALGSTQSPTAPSSYRATPSASSSAGTITSSSPTGASPSRSSSGSASGSASGSSSVSPSGADAADVRALCKDWLALPSGLDPAKQEARFAVLIRLAGGVEAVTPYCRSLPTPSSSGSTSLSGSVSASPSGSSAESPSPSPTGSAKNSGQHDPVAATPSPSPSG